VVGRVGGVRLGWGESRARLHARGGDVPTAVPEHVVSLAQGAAIIAVLSRPFDAVLVLSFGGPRGAADVRPFVAHVLHGRRVPPERIEEVVRHYEHFGGVSPITEITMRQAWGLAERLGRDGPRLPVFVGMRHWHPFLMDTLERMAQAGVRRAIGLVMAAQRSYSSCLQYKEHVGRARRHLRDRGRPDVSVTYVDDWHAHPGFVAAWTDQVREAFDRLPARHRERARLIFTAHSIPVAMAEAYPYCQQLREGAARVAAAAGVGDWALVYQSRSGRPEDAWLEPDIGDYLRTERARGLEAAVVCPLGFVCDHVEVLYDLDVQAMAVARELGVVMVRARTPALHPQFLDTLAELVRRTYARYERGIPLPLAVPEDDKRPCRDARPAP